MEVQNVSHAHTSSENLRSLSASEPKPVQTSEAHTRIRMRQSHASHRSAGLGVFQHELRSSLKAQFKVNYPASQSAYANPHREVTSDDVANDALNTARQLVAESPTKASKSLITFRATVRESASIARNTIGPNSDHSALDKAVASVDAGISKLEDEVAPNRSSSATVLDVETKTKQRSTIKIRTQEGDIVRLSLKRQDKLSLHDQSASEGGRTETQTEVAVSSRSRLALKIEGDLNEAEFAAIQNVFAQAENIANEFFGGNISAAFDAASGFEFDSEQLARVRLGFRSSSRSDISFRETVTSESAEAPSGQPTEGAAPLRSSATSSDGAASLRSSANSTESSRQPVAESPKPRVDDVTAGPEPQVDQALEPDVGTTPITIGLPDLTNLFETLSTFLRSVGEGFASSEPSIRLHYSESFKLEFLKAVVHTVAPPESEAAPKTVGTIIDGIVGDLNA